MKLSFAAMGTLAVSLIACLGGDPVGQRPTDCAEDPSLPGCRKQDPECRSLPKSEACLDRTFFRTVVRPLFDRHCTVCHVEGGLAWGSTGLSLVGDSAWDSLVNVPSQEMVFTRTPMMRVRPGIPESSYLYLKISMPVPPFGGRMPLTDTVLTRSELAAVRDWILGRPY